MAELFQYNIISSADLLFTIQTIFNQLHLLVKSQEQIPTVEEYADCVLRLLRVLSVNPAVIGRIAPQVLASVDIDALTVRSADKPGLTNKVRFAMMDARKFLGGKA